jgi:hypothetical protein
MAFLAASVGQIVAMAAAEKIAVRGKVENAHTPSTGGKRAGESPPVFTAAMVMFG